MALRRVAPPPAASYVRLVLPWRPSGGTDRSGGTRAWTLAPVAGLLLASVLAGCAPRQDVRPLAEPAPELEERLLAETRPNAPSRVIFAWRLNERGSRLEGRGVARVEAPYRARLDLFTDNGETAARAALVGGEVRTPPEVDLRLVPPPALLWASLGVFRPPADAELLGGEAVGETGRRLRYRTVDGGEARFHLADGRLTAVELSTDGSVTRRVELEWPPGGRFPSRASYRDLTAFRELAVTLESTERSDGFSPDIWNLDD